MIGDELDLTLRARPGGGRIGLRAADMGRLADLEFACVGRRHKTENVDLVFHVDDVGNHLPGRQRLADDDLQPAEPAFARGGERVELQLPIQGFDLVIGGGQLHDIGPGMRSRGIQGDARLFEFDWGDQLHAAGPAFLLLLEVGEPA